MQIGIAGSGPAADSVRAAYDDIDATATTATPGDLGSYPLGVVIAPAGAPAFEAADGAATRWLAVEIGGLGGVALGGLDAAVTVFADGVGYRDLRERVDSAVDDGNGEEGRATGSRSAVRLAGAVAGHRAVSLLSGADLAGTVVEVPGGERRVLAVPRLEDRDRDRDLRRTHRDVSLDDALDRAERAVDDRVGLLTRVGERESFPAPYYLAATADTTAYSDARAAAYTAGVDDDWDRAFVKALGEGLERYCAGVYRGEEFEMAPSAREDGVSPAAFVRPDGRSVDSEAPIPWVPGEDLATGEAVALPAEFVHYPPPEGRRERHRPAITTGLGLGNAGVEALLSGLYEVIERDATMLAWYSTYDPLGLSVDDEGFSALVARARAVGLSVTPVLLTADVDVPVVAVASGHGSPSGRAPTWTRRPRHGRRSRRRSRTGWNSGRWAPRTRRPRRVPSVTTPTGRPRPRSSWTSTAACPRRASAPTRCRPARRNSTRWSTAPPRRDSRRTPPGSRRRTLPPSGSRRFAS
jgi:ribosomal protein S12 methylthiotransferase accessory factor